MQLQRVNYCSRISLSSLLLHILLAIVALPTVTPQNELLIPDYCEMRRPRNDQNPCDTSRRWFMHDTKGCKRFGICVHQTADLDVQTGINYFTSYEDCQRACMQGIVCGNLTAPENGNVTFDEFIGWGGSATYSCDEGYTLTGTSTRECQKSATWTSTAPTCEKQCTPPPKIEHATIAPVHNYYNPGTRIFYDCEEGYSSTITERTCEAGGVWSGPEPKCQFQMKQCPEPVLIHNAVVTAPDRSVGRTVTYACNDGFILIGNDTRTCGEDGLWEGDSPVCWKMNLVYFIEDSTQMEREDITNGTVTLAKNTQNVWVVAESSDPNPLIGVPPIWYFNDDLLLEMERPHGVELDERMYKLKFSRILESQEQQGNYTIKIGQYSVSFLLVVVNEEPTTSSSQVKAKLVIMPVEQEIGLGENVTFSCLFTGCPNPNVTWFHNDTALTPHGERVKDVIYSHGDVTYSYLTINNVSKEDEGRYRCYGDNNVGNVSSANVNLGVLPVQTTARRKRKADLSSMSAQSRSTLCKQASDPESVTLVATVKKELRRVRDSRQLRNYRFQVSKVLRGQMSSSLVSKRSLRAFVSDSIDDSTSTHLQANDKYILSGRMLDDVLYISGPQYMHHYSTELESHIQSC